MKLVNNVRTVNFFTKQLSDLREELNISLTCKSKEYLFVFLIRLRTKAICTMSQKEKAGDVQTHTRQKSIVTKNKEKNLNPSAARYATARYLEEPRSVFNGFRLLFLFRTLERRNNPNDESKTQDFYLVL